jgi:hypothetical protein
MRGAIPLLPQYAFMVRCSVKKKHRDNFTFYLISLKVTLYFKNMKSYISTASLIIEISEQSLCLLLHMTLTKHFYPKAILMLTISVKTTLGGSLVTTAWHVLRLRMEERPPDMEGSCEYIE